MIGQVVHFIPDPRGQVHAAIIVDEDKNDPLLVDLMVFPRRDSEPVRRDQVNHESNVSGYPRWREIE